MPIRLLSEEIAARIAAGEVVERPASVVKELVENSLDAGATRVEVETRAGGQTLIRARDNGAGIPAAEVALAFRRHATSKLTSAADLDDIGTLGFRGEALASIASVSRVTCLTRHVAEETGTRLRLEGGAVVGSAPSGRPPGTELVIEDLFYNVPARRKFLRAERTERRHIDAFLTRYAIAYPQIAFHVVHDGREILNTSGQGTAREALVEVYGLDLGSHLLAIPPELTAEDAIQVRGFVGPTTVHRADRGYITVFVNGRWVEDLRLTYAIIQAYHTLLPHNRYPVAFVEVTLPAPEVDVNVHPAKTEVRFRDGDAVFRAVQRAVRAAVIEQAPAAASWQPPEGAPAPTPAPSIHTRLAALQPATQISFPAPSREAPPPSHITPSPTSAAPDASASLPPLRVIGQAATMFIIAEGPNGIYLIDQHAAHERILYERMLAAWVAGDAPAQPLLEPVTVTLPPDAAERLEAQLPLLPALGLEVEPFGRGAFLVRALPALLPNVAPAELLADIAAAVDTASTDGDSKTPSPIHSEREEQLVRRICKRVAVKAGQVLAPEEMHRLVRDLERTRNPRTCPHGRPTILQLSAEELARQFGRG